MGDGGAEAMARLVEGSRPFVRFRVERLLAKADLSSLEGKDRALEELKPVFRLLRPSVQRSALVSRVADRLNIPDEDADRLLREPSRTPEGASAPARRGPARRRA